MMNPLLDNDFLDELSKEQERTIYAKIIALDLNENPIEEITGNVSQGSISVDGTSAIRRSCSITLVAEDFNINDYYWGLNTKIKIFIGMKNNINSDYPDIIWFPQGVFVVTSFNTSQSTTGWSISLQGKDKMCLLNGDVGGSISDLSVDFGQKKVEIEDTGIYEKQDILLKTIIEDAVHTYAKEPYSNIIVNDLDDVGLELLKYRSDEDMYLLVNLNTNEVENFKMASDTSGEYYLDNSGIERITLADIPVYDNRITLDFGEGYNEYTVIYSYVDYEWVPYSVIHVTYDDVIGYRVTDLTYAGDLIASVGNSITNAVLDKIVSQLGEFEYFYNLDGQFVFQKKKTYVNTLFNNIVQNTDNDTYETNSMQTSSYTYSFEDSNLITAFQNAPNLANVKNDYSVWGTRTDKTTSVEIPIHLRYAIDKKPTEYTTFGGITYITQSKEDYIADLTTSIRIELESAINKMSQYTKTPNPNNLPEDWWEIMDWAEYYKILYGTYPEGEMCLYANGGSDSKDVAIIDLSKYFEIPDNADYGILYYQQNPVYLFDITYKDGEDITKSYLGYTGHGCSCGHPYSYFTSRARSGIGTSYIYNPVLPKILAERKYEERMAEVEKTLENKTLRCDCDWRELIYQMARDDSLYHHNDDGTINEDFIPTLISNNPTTCANGMTGYEQYYTDMYSFWRDIYDPDPETYDSALFYETLKNSDVKANWSDYLSKRTLYFKNDSDEYILVTDDLPDKILGDPKSKGSDTTPKYTYNSHYTYYTDIEDKSLYQYDSSLTPPYKELSLYDDIIGVKDVPTDIGLYDKYGTLYETNVDNLYIRTVTNYFSNYNANLKYYYYTDDGHYVEVQADESTGLKFFDVTKNYYTYRGYVPIAAIKTGYDYYTRSGTATYGYEYTYAFSIKYGVTYTNLTDSSIGFERGKMYLSSEAGSSPFTIPVENLYIQGGDSTGYAPVYTANTFKPGMYYYLDSETEEYVASPLGENTVALGAFNYGYQEADESNLTSGIAYHKNISTGEFESVNVLLAFDTRGQYFTISNNELVRYEHRVFKKAGTVIVSKEDKTKNATAQAALNDTLASINQVYEQTKKDLTDRLQAGTISQATYDSLLELAQADKDTDTAKAKSSYNLYTTTLTGCYYLTNTFNALGWTCDLENPELLNFWIDFLDTEGELSQYSVPTIGIRPKAENNKDVTSIYYRETPTVIFVDPDDDITEQKKQKPGYTFVRCPEYLEQLFTLSSQKKSAKDELDSLLYKYTYCTESITITSLPIYHLRPNTRIFVHDEKSGINGEYIVTKFTVPLAYNGTMSITATKAVEDMY